MQITGPNPPFTDDFFLGYSTQYSVFIEWYPDPFIIENMPAAAGDTFWCFIELLSTTTALINIANMSQAVTMAFPISSPADMGTPPIDNGYGAWIVENVNLFGEPYLPQFGAVVFTDCGGKTPDAPIDPTTGTAAPLTMLDSNNYPMAQPSIVGPYAFQVAYNSPGTSSMSAGGIDATALTLTSATVQFDNVSSGKDSTVNYWISLSPGLADNPVATLTEDPAPGYSQGQAQSVTLAISAPPPTFGDFLQQGGGNLVIALNGNFGGGHQNSDWKTGVTLTLGFGNAQLQIPLTWSEIDLHVDSTNQSASFTFNFTSAPLISAV